MGTHVIKMPDIGEGIAEVELVVWHVKPGDPVAEDQPLAEVMTDKASVEIPSPVSGKVLALGGEVGKVMAVGAELIRIEVAGEGNVAASAAAPPSAQAPAPAPAKAPTRAAAPAPAPAPAARPAATPARPAPAPTAEPDEDTATSLPAVPPGERPLASPSVRQRAWDAGIELRFVKATGKIGQVTHADLDAYEAGQTAAPALAPRAASQAPRTGETTVPVIGLRRKIAERMQEAKRHIPHFTYVEELDLTELEALRAHLNAKWGATRGKLNPLPFIAKAMVRALESFPQINARYDDEAGVVTRHAAVHLGVAAQTPNGLVVPVVRHAETLDLWQTGAEIARLAAAARNGKATRDELSGSTITITSLGALGGIVTTPVINRPEVAIVGVNRIVERPVYRQGAVVPRLIMNLSSSFDHRVVDGMDAAEFIQSVQALLEHPALLFMEQA
jgi:2-oxoisovalerate dehydrogenase E2 component (dihydrolipoyl transacylase)